jgi:hypothetical protein
MFTYECRTSRQANVSIARSWNRSISLLCSSRALTTSCGALAAGERDNGRPGERRYHPGYYAAFVLDPDGNNIDAVCHDPAARSASSVVVTPAA